jgi:hypothetical protein
MKIKPFVKSYKAVKCARLIHIQRNLKNYSIVLSIQRGLVLNPLTKNFRKIKEINTNLPVVLPDMVDNY